MTSWVRLTLPAAVVASVSSVTVAIGRGETDPDAQVRDFGVGIVTAVELGDRLRIDVTGLGLDQNAFLEFRFEDALQGDEERRTVVTVPVRIGARRDLGVVDLDLDLRILRDGRVQLIEEDVPKELLARPGVATELQRWDMRGFHDDSPCG